MSVSQPPEKPDYKKVLGEEQKLLRERRGAAQLPEQPEGEPIEDLVGLALSGGGIRSGAFCFGFLQALCEAGVNRYVDYLSTVSGGGYAGAFLSTLAANQKDPIKSIASKEGGSQPKAVMELVYSGNYLNMPWEALCRYFAGLLLVLGFVLSGLVCAAALVAYSFRLLDHKSSRFWLDRLGFGDDLSLAFFPAATILLLWVVFSLLSYLSLLKDQTAAIAKGLFVLFAAALALAIAALLGTGDINARVLFEWAGLSGTSLPTHGVGRAVSTALVLTLVAALLPYLRPSALIRSGTRPGNAAEKYVFWFATRAVLFGVPFGLVMVFARENISRFNNTRPAMIYERTEVCDWSRHGTTRLWQTLILGSDKNPDTLAHKILKVIETDLGHGGGRSKAQRSSCDLGPPEGSRAGTLAPPGLDAGAAASVRPAFVRMAT